VLESQPVYWMSLAVIPVSVLNQIRKMMFSFLWKGCSEKHHFHLCRWETLAKPKYYGGWGFQNIHLFNKALAASTLWCVLMKEGIWHRVIKDKYFFVLLGSNLAQICIFCTTSASNTWKKLLKVVHIITHWLSWSPGSGHSVLIGRDNILGLGNSSVSVSRSPVILTSVKHNSSLSGQRNKSARLYLHAVERKW
jgi:hypothetical protein